jgi:hypothetical protein
MKKLIPIVLLSTLFSTSGFSSEQSDTNIGKNAEVKAKIIGGVVATVNGDGVACTKVAAISNAHVGKNAKVDVKIIGGVVNTVVGNGKSSLIVGSIGGVEKGGCSK